MGARGQFACLLIALIAPFAVLDGQTQSLGAPPATPAAAAPAAKPTPATSAKPAAAAVTPAVPSTPPKAPEVNLSNGLLTIRAEDSTLSDVLKAVQQVTGASIEDPGFAGERIYFRGGPGAPRDVLASLLNGSRYDYILLGSQQQPIAVTRIILSVRTNIQPTTTAAAAPSPPPPADTNDSDEASSPPTPSQPSAQPPVPQPAAGVPQPGQPPAQGIPGQPPQPGQPAGQVKTPEQMLQELQKIQQQQQQQLQLQQQLNNQNNFSR
jgi:hypothetical protein